MTLPAADGIERGLTDGASGGEVGAGSESKRHLAAERAGDSLRAIANALKLGASLVATLLIAVAMKFVMPRYLGPSLFGTLSFADGFAATFFVALSLGAEAYIRKEVSVRPSHASDFFGGTFALRVAITGLIFAAMAIVMHLTGRPPEVMRLVYLFGVAQFFVNANATLSALLHAKGRVDAMSALAVATKIIWAGGVVASIVWRTGLWGFAAAFLASESVETVVLFALARRHLGLLVRIDPAATKKMIVGSLPYFLNGCATGAYGKADVTLLGILGTNREVGWYVAASSITGLTLLITPLIDWVLTPVFARGAARSREDLYLHIRQATEPILAVAIPAALFVSVGADLWLKMLFGHAYAPATLALRVLASASVVIYIAIVYAMTLIMLERAWTLTLISIAGLLVNLALNFVLIRPAIATFGDGGGGVGCALAALGTHLFVTAVMIGFVGRDAFDGRTFRMVAKSLAASALVVVVDRLTVRLGYGRIAVDVAVYLAVVVGTGALRLGDMWRMVTAAVRDKSGVSPRRA